MTRRAIATLLAILAIHVQARAGDPARGVTLDAEVLPLLKARCVSCHGPAERKAKLNLASPRGLARGGENGPVVTPRDLDASPLWERVEADEMPPKKPLDPDEKAILRRWIAEGAAGLPKVESSEPESNDHPAFATLQKPSVPDPRDAVAAVSPIDRFLLARLEPAGLTFAPPADRATLIRRLSFDLTGLPPSPDEVAAFEQDRGPDPYGRLVERLLASPAYGERWGKYWLDAAGYADSNGYFNADTDRPLAYRYRDWVIKATAADRPFDQFVAEQIAGDELSGFKPGVAVTPAMAEMLVATHFFRNGQDGTGESDGNPDELRADRYSVLEGAVQIFGSSLLGLTLQCARCHDHKFEPVTQRDYYGLQAVLRPAFPVEKWVKPNDRVVFAATAAEQNRWETETKRIDQAVAAARQAFRDWRESHKEPSVIRFTDAFDAPLAGRWQGLAIHGRGPLHLDSPTPPAAVVRDAQLAILDAGQTSGVRLATAATFDWTPDEQGQWIEASFLLKSLNVGDSPKSERIAYYIAAHDGASTPFERGNLLIDGNPAGAAVVDAGYPGPSPKRVGPIGSAKYRAGHRFGVRVTNIGKGRFRLEHVVDGEPESNALTLLARDLPDGRFAFEYCCGRSFQVDDVTITVSDPSLAPDARAKLTAEREQHQKQLDDAIKALEAQRTAQPGKVAWVSDLMPNPPEGHILKRGNYGDPGPKAEPTAIASLTDANNTFKAEPPAANTQTTGRRLALARWLTRPGSRPAALLARVTVNRVWQHHFGVGLVATPENLGYTGATPTHPELLEWLAASFVDSGWSLKALHRRIVGSRAYQQASDPSNPTLVARVDPDNRLLSHYPLRRLDAEAIRDAMLAVSGELDSAHFGPYVPTNRQGDGEVVVDPKTPGALRRSLYLQQRRTQVTSLLDTFDAPSIVTNCPKRAVSTIPLQSLSLLNSRFTADRARAFAARLDREAGDDVNRRLDRAFRLAAGRSPTVDECELARHFLEEQPARYSGLKPRESHAKVWNDFCHALIISNIFLYIE